MYCTHCNINWLRLSSQEDEGDEVVEFCPLCKNDRYLIEKKEGNAFIMCPFTGIIYDPRSLMQYPSPQSNKMVQANESFDKEAWRENKEQQEKKEMERIDKYIAESEIIGKEKAEQNYFNRV